MEHASREPDAVNAPEAVASARAPELEVGDRWEDAQALGSWDGASRARAVATMQARHGNAWVGRRLARRKVIDTTGSGQPYYFYDRTTFPESRYDGKVDPVAGTITVILRVKYQTDGPSFASVNMADEDIKKAVNKFKSEFAPAVKGVWEDKYALKPSAPIDARGWYRPKVQIVEDDTNPHAKINVMFPKAGFASNVERHKDETAGVLESTLTIDDTKATTKEWVKKKRAGQLPKDSDKVPFSQVVAAHEFGHLINLRHINQDKKSGPDEYGGTYEQANDIMGYGNSVSKRDMEAWLKIGEAYAAEIYPNLKITWSLIDPQW